jgi:hypothetical protein
MQFANVKPSVVSWATVGIMAITFIVVAKWLASRYNIPGVTSVIQAV